MKLIYFSLGYSTHDYRFLKAISDGGHEAVIMGGVAEGEVDEFHVSGVRFEGRT